MATPAVYAGYQLTSSRLSAPDPKTQVPSHLRPTSEPRPSRIRNNARSCDPAGLVQITKTSESRKYEKITKNIQNPLRVGDRKYEKITEKMQKSPTKNHHFCIFSVIFFVFSGPNPGRGFCIFFVIFSYFRDSEVFVICTRPAGLQARSEK